MATRGAGVRRDPEQRVQPERRRADRWASIPSVGLVPSVALVALVALLLGLVTAPAQAQTTTEPTTERPVEPPVENTTAPPVSGVATLAAPLPGDTVAPIPSLAAQPGPQRNDLDVTDVFVAPSLDSENPDVVVQFAAPFALPAAHYAVSVLVGDPNGDRLRASFVSITPTDTPTGTIERYEGGVWRDEGGTSVTFDPSGFIVIDVPHTTAPPGGAAWAEINVGNMATATRITPYYSRASFFHSAPEGTLPGGTFARVLDADGNLARQAADIDAAPVLRVADGRVVVDAPVPAPMVLDAAVQRTTDTILLAPDFNEGGHDADEIVIDWTARSITLREAGAPTTDRSGDGAWIVSGFPAAGSPPGAAGAPTGDVSFSFDLATIATTLGITLDPATYGIGLTRTYALADGRQVVADGMLGTQQWFDRRPVVLPEDPPTTVPAPVAPAEPMDVPVGLIVAIAAGVAVVVLLVLLVVLSRRRRRRRRADEAAGIAAVGSATGEDRIPWAREDGARTATAEMDVIRIVTGAVPVVVIDDEPSPVEHGTPAVVVEPVDEIEPVEPVDEVELVDEVGPVEASSVDEVEPIDEVGSLEPVEVGPVDEVELGPVDEVATVEAAIVDGVDPVDEVGPDDEGGSADGDEPEDSDEPEHGDASDETWVGDDPASFLAALDLDLGSFKSRLEALDEVSPAEPR